MKAVVGLDGAGRGSALVRARVQGAGLVVAADGGARGLRALGLRPDVVTGDFDSLSASELGELRADGVEVVAHPAPEERTDGEVALALAVERGATEVVLVGALGGERADHEAGNLLLATAARWAGVAVSLVDGGTEATVLRGDGRRAVRVEGAAGDLVSVVAVSERVRGVRTAGLRWPLSGAVVERGESGAMSNELVGSVGEVEIEEGVALVFLTIAKELGDRQGT